ncbi:MAG: signal peptide peptidase SppA [Acetobacteraceae bacterium]
MSAEIDLLLDRRRLKHRLIFWRAAAVILLLAVVLLAIVRSGLALRFESHPHVAVLHVNGIIADDAARDRAVLALAATPSVKALIVAVDSPGGSVAGGEALHDAIARVAAKKPVVVVMGPVAASAAYMISVPAARIFARQATLTGSIGVLLQTGEVSGLLSKLGITSETIVSGPLKDQPNFTAPMTDAARKVMQGIVDNLYGQFVAMVAAGRHMSIPHVKRLADGRPYTGEQALGLGLIDAIGGMAEARAWLASAKGIPTSLPEVTLAPAGRSWLGRGLGLGGAWGSLAKVFLSQRVNLDGAWALWQPDQVLR